MKGGYSIEAKGLGIGYVLSGGRRAVVHEGLDLHLCSGSVTCLLGLNGAGKSTLLRTLCGFQKPLSGEIFINGRALSSFTQSELALTVGVVLTEKTNAGGISVYELVALGRHPYTGFFGSLRPQDHAIVRKSLEAAGIAHKADSFVSELSDGERQKAMIAKVLAQQCPIIVLDEPTAFLDVTSRIETMALLRRVASEQGKTVLLSTHDLELAIQMGDNLWLQQPSRAMATGTPEDLILGGIMGGFFDRGGIKFDKTTGRLNAFPSDQGLGEWQAGNTPEGREALKIGIEGDFTTSYWMGNAVIRNGYLPSPVAPSYPHIICKSASSFTVRFPDGKEKEAASVAEVLTILAGE